MKKRITVLAVTLISFAALAAHHESAEDEVRAAAEAFSTAYVTNDIEGYFGFYADGATVFFTEPDKTCPRTTKNGLR